MILVTGATGFVGSHLVDSLGGVEPLRALARQGADASALEAAGIEIVRGDLRDADAARRAVEGCRVVHHLAALTSHGGASARDMFETNVEGTVQLAEAALASGVERFVFASAVKVYGVSRRGTIDEHTPRDPVSPYALSKARAEDLLFRLAEERSLPLVVARLGGMLGAGAVGWLGLFRSVADGSFRMLGSGRGRYPAADVDDVVAGIRRSGEVPGIEGRVYNLTGPPVTLAELVDAIADEVGAPPRRRPLPAAPLHAYRILQRAALALTGRSLPRFSRVELFLGDRAFDISRARRDLGYDPKTDLRASVARTARWFRERELLPAPREGPGYIRLP
ncbi:MAG TPA: NAD-dependent epimerase/dehydratase family protein [Gemmatimonadota bacterium]|nr:NAD-dependent epimerase/dehydratase family protein [Gemmatimonadota bacterium]